tara:strand:- start:1649 stop:1984 length:336 start_codon:yes stop_codon:yes gene_type:complete
MGNKKKRVEGYNESGDGSKNNTLTYNSPVSSPTSGGAASEYLYQQDVAAAGVSGQAISAFEGSNTPAQTLSAASQRNVVSALRSEQEKIDKASKGKPKDDPYAPPKKDKKK